MVVNHSGDRKSETSKKKKSKIAAAMATVFITGLGIYTIGSVSMSMERILYKTNQAQQIKMVPDLNNDGLKDAIGYDKEDEATVYIAQKLDDGNIKFITKDEYLRLKKEEFRDESTGKFVNLKDMINANIRNLNSGEE